MSAEGVVTTWLGNHVVEIELCLNPCLWTGSFGIVHPAPDLEVELAARLAHPSGPWLPSLLDDADAMSATCQVDIRGGGADVSSIHLDLGRVSSGADICVHDRQVGHGEDLLMLQKNAPVCR